MKRNSAAINFLWITSKWKISLRDLFPPVFVIFFHFSLLRHFIQNSPPLFIHTRGSKVIGPCRRFSSELNVAFSITLLLLRLVFLFFGGSNIFQLRISPQQPSNAPHSAKTNCTRLSFVRRKPRVFVWKLECKGHSWMPKGAAIFIFLLLSFSFYLCQTLLFDFLILCEKRIENLKDNFVLCQNYVSKTKSERARTSFVNVADRGKVQRMINISAHWERFSHKKGNGLYSTKKKLPLSLILDGQRSLLKRDFFQKISDFLKKWGSDGSDPWNVRMHGNSHVFHANKMAHHPTFSAISMSNQTKILPRIPSEGERFLFPETSSYLLCLFTLYFPVLLLFFALFFLFLLLFPRGRPEAWFSWAVATQSAPLGRLFHQNLTHPSVCFILFSFHSPRCPPSSFYSFSAASSSPFHWDVLRLLFLAAVRFHPKRTHCSSSSSSPTAPEDVSLSLWLPSVVFCLWLLLSNFFFSSTKCFEEEKKEKEREAAKQWVDEKKKKKQISRGSNYFRGAHVAAKHILKTRF